MDSDDISIKERARIQLEFLDKNPDVSVLGSYIEEFIENDGHITKIWADLLRALLASGILGKESAKKAVDNKLDEMVDADIEIVEKHHNRKLDAPSGTALMLADAVKEIRKDANYVFGRGGDSKRTKEEIGIHAVRAGNIVGEHEIIICSDTQTITLKHEAHSRALFAEGAVAAAEFLVSCTPGLYGMQDMINK